MLGAGKEVQSRWIIRPTVGAVTRTGFGLPPLVGAGRPRELWTWVFDEIRGLADTARETPLGGIAAKRLGGGGIGTTRGVLIRDLAVGEETLLGCDEHASLVRRDYV